MELRCQFGQRALATNWTKSRFLESDVLGCNPTWLKGYHLLLLLMEDKVWKRIDDCFPILPILDRLLSGHIIAIPRKRWLTNTVVWTGHFECWSSDNWISNILHTGRHWSSCSGNSHFHWPVWGIFKSYPCSLELAKSLGSKVEGFVHWQTKLWDFLKSPKKFVVCKLWRVLLSKRDNTNGTAIHDGSRNRKLLFAQLSLIAHTTSSLWLV